MKISIITVSYNSAATIRDTLRSVAEQSHPEVEHIVIDGASPDQTADIVRQFPHVDRLLSEPDEGLYHAMNKGLALASGEVIGLLNADDFYSHPEVLARVAAQFEQPGVQALYGDLQYVHPEQLHRILRHWRAGPYQTPDFRRGWMPPHPTFFVRRHWYETLGNFDLEFRMAADYELMLRFLYKHRVPATYLPEVLVRMRAGGISNASWRHRWRAHQEDRKAWVKNGLQPAHYTLWLKPLRKIPQLFPFTFPR
ncbi:MAG: glycosyltransferase [Saprospiraceae bacterium]|nr:glycosyltransferase [Saprospiraceae bacterium]